MYFNYGTALSRNEMKEVKGGFKDGGGGSCQAQIPTEFGYTVATNQIKEMRS